MTTCIIIQLYNYLLITKSIPTFFLLFCIKALESLLLLTQPSKNETNIVAVGIRKFCSNGPDATAGNHTSVPRPESPVMPQNELPVTTVSKRLVMINILGIGENILAIEVGHPKHILIKGNSLGMAQAQQLGIAHLFPAPIFLCCHKINC